MTYKRGYIVECIIRRQRFNFDKSYQTEQFSNHKQSTKTLAYNTSQCVKELFVKIMTGEISS